MKRRTEDRTSDDAISMAPSESSFQSHASRAPALKRKRTLFDRASSAAGKLVGRNVAVPMWTPKGTSFGHDQAPVPESEDALVGLLCSAQGGFDMLTERTKLEIAFSGDIGQMFKSYSALLAQAHNAVIKQIADARERAHKHYEYSALQGFWLDLLQHMESDARKELDSALLVGGVGEGIIASVREQDETRKTIKQQEKKARGELDEAAASLARLRGKMEGSSEEWSRASKEEAKADADEAAGAPKNGGAATGLQRARTVLKPRGGEADARRKASQALVSYKEQAGTVNDLMGDFYSKSLPGFVSSVLKLHDDRMDLTRDAFVEVARSVESVKIARRGSFGNSITMRVAVMDRRDHVRRHAAEYGASAAKVDRQPINVTSEMMSMSVPQVDAGVKRARPSTLGALLRRERGTVPIIVQKCIEEVERRGLNNEGIYRMSGVKSQVDALKADFDADAQAVDLSTNDNAADINAVTGTLKVFFRDLADGVIPRSDYDDVLNAAQEGNVAFVDERLQDLPPGNKETFRFIAQHLRKVVDNAQENKMSAANIGVVLGPSLFSCKHVDAPGADMQEEEIARLSKQRALLTMIVENATLGM